MVATLHDMGEDYYHVRSSSTVFTSKFSLVRPERLGEMFISKYLIFPDYNVVVGILETTVNRETN